MTEQDWDEVINVHLKGTFACTKSAVAIMKTQQSGSIVNITAGAALRGSAGQSNYSAAKAGIIAFSISCARELIRSNVRVNVVRPRARTTMTEAAMERILKRVKEEALKSKSPVPTAQDLGYGDPEKVAPLVVFLASDEAAGITGQILSLSGNRLSLFSLPQEVKSAIMPEGWTLELLIKHIKFDFALDLERTKLQPTGSSFI